MDNRAGGEQLYDGASAETLTRQLGLPVFLYDSVTSTQDVAYDHAAKSSDRVMLILADSQTAGRGRAGHKWSAPPRSGIWLTLLDRSVDRAALDVLSLRIGLGAAHALDAFTSEPVQLKWPNDLYVEQRKLAGTLVEVRWRQDVIEWVAIGFGVNLTPPADHPHAIGLEVGTHRLDVLPALVRELRSATAAKGPLKPEEIEEFDARDLARGRTCIEPVRGRVQGITPAGELLVELADAIVKIRSGSLVLE